MLSNEGSLHRSKDGYQLKLRGSYGLAGNDNSATNVSPKPERGSVITFGYEIDGYSRPGMIIRRYADPEISWEVSYKTNLAMELTLFDDLNVIWEYFTENRKNILQERRTIPYSMGLWVNPNANLGEAKGRGTDFSLTHSFAKGKSFWMQSRVNFTMR